MLNRYIEKLPEPADCLYLHDIAILTKIAGKGVGFEVVKKFKQFTKEKGYTAISAIAVMGTIVYWEKHGFIETVLDSKKHKSLIEHYGANTNYITYYI